MASPAQDTLPATVNSMAMALLGLAAIWIGGFKRKFQFLININQFFTFFFKLFSQKN